MGLLDILGISAFKAKRETSKAKEPANQPEANAASDECEGSVGALSAGQMHDLKRLHLSAKDLCSSLDQTGSCASWNHTGRSLADIFQTDSMRFFLHLAIADGELNPAEAAFMNAVLDCNKTVGEWAIAAIRLEVKSMAHRGCAPFSFCVMQRAGQEANVDVRETLIPAFQQLGDALILADGQASPEELERLKEYMDDVCGALDALPSETALPDYPLAIE